MLLNSDYLKTLYGRKETLGLKGKLFFNYLKLRFILTRKPSLSTVAYVLTTKCNLRCRHCSTYVPYYDKDAHIQETTFEQFKTDLDKLLQAVDKIYVLNFFGGEPLLINDIHKMIAYALHKKQIKYLHLTTNGTIMPPPELIRILKKARKKIAVQVSDYRGSPIIKDLKLTEIIAMLDKEKITRLHYSTSPDTWKSMPKIYYNPRPAEQITVQAYRCYKPDAYKCLLLADGKLYYCSTALYVHRNIDKINKGHQFEKTDIIDVRNSLELTEDLLRLYGTPYNNNVFCQFCNSGERKIINPAEQI
jgi:organic radical activating enzyme